MTEALNRIVACKDIESVHEVIADILIEDSLEMQRLYEQVEMQRLYNQDETFKVHQMLIDSIRIRKDGK